MVFQSMLAVSMEDGAGELSSSAPKMRGTWAGPSGSEIADRFIDMVGLLGFGDHYPTELSGRHAAARDGWPAASPILMHPGAS